MVLNDNFRSIELVRTFWRYSMGFDAVISKSWDSFVILMSLAFIWAQEGQDYVKASLRNYAIYMQFKSDMFRHQNFENRTKIEWVMALTIKINIFHPHSGVNQTRAVYGGRGATVRSEPPDFSLQVNLSRSRPRQLQLPRSTSEEKPEIRESRSPGCATETA